MSNSVKKKIFKTLSKKIRDPLLYVALILAGFWILDTWYKLAVQNAPTRMLWYSSTGLAATSVALLTRNKLLLTSLFCLLIFQETVWLISFFSNLFSLKDYFHLASYAFGKSYPKIELFITLFHLLILPSIFYGLYKIKSASRYGWLGAYVFALIINYLPLIFPDSIEDVNCVRGDIESCRMFFEIFYKVDPSLGILGGVTYQLVVLYIPANFLLIKLMNNKQNISKFLNRVSKSLKKVLLHPAFNSNLDSKKN